MLRNEPLETVHTVESFKEYNKLEKEEGLKYELGGGFQARLRVLKLK